MFLMQETGTQRSELPFLWDIIPLTYRSPPSSD